MTDFVGFQNNLILAPYRLSYYGKGQLISKWLFGVFSFLQKHVDLRYHKTELLRGGILFLIHSFARDILAGVNIIWKFKNFSVAPNISVKLFRNFSETSF